MVSCKHGETLNPKTNTCEDKFVKYPKTDKFRIIDTIGVPHPYCITPKHVAIASDEFMGMLGEPAINRAEEKGIHCDICKKVERKTGKPCLSYEEHKQALLVEVNDKRELKDIPELQPYLLSIKNLAEKDGFVGFAFTQSAKASFEREHEGN